MKKNQLAANTMNIAGQFLLLAGLSPVVLTLFSSCNSSGGSTLTEKVSPDTATVNALLKKASSYNQSKHDSMHLLADSAGKLAAAIHYREGVIRAKGIEASYQKRKGNFPTAASIALEAINAYDSLGRWKEKVRMQNFLADIYKQMGEGGAIEFLEKGIEISRQSQQLAEEKKYYAGIIDCYNEQGIILRDLSRRTKRKELIDSAFVLYQKAVKIAEENGDDERQLGKLYNNITQVYNEQYADYPKALEYVRKAEAFNKSQNFLNGLSYNYNNMADIYMRMGEYDKAKEHAHKMLAVCAELNAPQRTLNAYNQLTRITKRMKQYDSALYYKEWSAWLSDSLENVEKTSRIADMQTKYETKEKESQISLLSEHNQAQKQRLWMLGGAALILASLAGIFIWQNRRLQQQKKQIAEQSERLGWMMKELHHRVKNNLQIVSSLLNLQTYRLKDEESKSAIKESQLRVQAMSLIHQRLYQVEDVSMVNFKLYLDDLAETLMKAYGYSADDFDLVIKVDKELLDVDTVMPMGLLVNEIITNSFKYAYKDVQRPLLTISLRSGDQQLQLDVTDNGPGMSEAVGQNSKPGFGKKLIDALTKQLKAQYTVDNSNGTSYSFTIPYNNEKAA